MNLGRQGFVPYADPLQAGRRPFQTYLFALCVVSGIPLLFGKPSAGSASTLLPSWEATCWGFGLAGGAALGVIGSYYPRRSYAPP